MNSRITITLSVGLLSLGYLLLGSGAVQPQEVSDQAGVDQQGQQQGVEVLTRGPVHEAFAEPTARGPRATPVIHKQPQGPIEELPPDQKPAGDNVIWVPGYWGWDDDRQDFLWVSGVWRAVPPERQWVPGYWNQVDDSSWQWVPGYWAIATQETVSYLPQPPDPVVEAVAEAPSENDAYVPGSWVYNDTRYMWRPGYWMQPRPGWCWMPAHYVWSPAGCVFVDGYWDFPLANRGLLFAPVVVQASYLNRPDWFYRPSFVVRDNFLLGALFVRLRWGHYYFGDYFEPQYRQLGFTSWVDYRVGRQFHDPLLNYYRWQHRTDPNWYRDIQNLYVARHDGSQPRPPRTLVQQNTVVNNVRNTTNVNNVTVVAPITKITNNTNIRLERVNQTQIATARKNIQQIRQVSQQRTQVEANLIARGGERRGTATSQPVRAELRGFRTENRSATVKAPPTPNVPRPVAQTPSRPDGRARPADGDGRNLPADRVNPRNPDTGTRPPTNPARPTPGTVPEDRRRPTGGEKPEPRPMNPRPNEAAPRPAPETRPAPRPGENTPRPPPPMPENRPAPRPNEAAPRPNPENRPAPRPAEAAPRPPAPQPMPEKRPEPRPATPRPNEATPRPAPESRPAPRPAPASESPRPAAPEPRPAARPEPRPAAEAKPKPAPTPRPADGKRPNP